MTVLNPTVGNRGTRQHRDTISAPFSVITWFEASVIILLLF